MRLLFYLAVWKRPEITEICFMGLNRLKNTGLFPMEFLAVISEESMIPLCKKYGVDYCFYKNLPLGEKKNFGLNEALKKSWDYIVELGSDDVLTSEFLELYKPYFDIEMLFINHFAHINSETSECRTFKSKTFYGLGRAIRRDVLEKMKTVPFVAKQEMITSTDSLCVGDTGYFVDREAHQMESSGLGEVVGESRYRLWPDNINRGLDNNSNFMLFKKGVLVKQVNSESPVGIDIKSRDNLWPFNPNNGHKESIEKVISGLSEDEKTAILSLRK